jgi:dipeptidyl aminopeptidase/acylaminoacyl peptidase
MRSSAFCSVAPQHPNLTIMHGGKDSVVPLQQSESFARALKQCGVENTLRVLPCAGHGGPEFEQQEILNLIGSFFDGHLRPNARR